jgi:hypothetical protein
MACLRAMWINKELARECNIMFWDIQATVWEVMYAGRLIKIVDDKYSWEKQKKLAILQASNDNSLA